MTNVKLAPDSPASYEAGESGANFTLVSEWGTDWNPDQKSYTTLILQNIWFPIHDFLWDATLLDIIIKKMITCL